MIKNIFITVVVATVALTIPTPQTVFALQNYKASATTGIGAPITIGSEIVGLFCDLADGVIYFAKGDIANGSLSAFSAIPVVGITGSTAKVKNLSPEDYKKVKETVESGGWKGTKTFSVSLTKQEGIDDPVYRAMIESLRLTK